jgi:hypothetical protein
MNPGESQSLSEAEALGRLSDALASMRARAAILEAARDQAAAARIDAARRAAELAGAADRRLKALESPAMLSAGARGPGAPRRPEQAILWTGGMATALLFALAAFWASGNAYSRRPPPDRPPPSATRAEEAPRRSPAPRRPDTVDGRAIHPATARNSAPVFELYSPTGPAAPPR